MLDDFKNFLKTPNWRRQHGWRRAVWQTMNRLGLTGLHALPMSRRWVDFHRRKMHLAGLDPALEGVRIVQLSDIHYSPVVGQRYLVQFIRWINDLQPDLVVITGDLITGGYRYAHRVSTILSHLHAKNGVICTFGNHDYSVYGKSHPGESTRRGDYLEKCLLDRGLIVLRNQTHYLRRDGAHKPVAIVGLDDEWTGNIDPEKAWAGVDPSLPIICLNHNPKNARELLPYPWQWMLAGHTHGRQLGVSRFGKRFNGHRRREFTHGHYDIDGRHLYVNRGLSYGQRVLDWCRPEVTVFKLTATPTGPIVVDTAPPAHS
ncbi:metallophosphoesterase [Humisphaera borealis]|uniref:Metallophosphoesterase n=1 Tax=Humisphaera borealis TaxID=2807512 RepID=A0A7M2WVK0_9BACT|nr:metallophosphoesterase [Humisphaera borealis]QOV89354.1 metallophosphoesterase [Humisphaera borealis]